MFQKKRKMKDAKTLREFFDSEDKHFQTMSLKEYFENTGVSQRFFAKKAGIATATLNDLIYGKRLPTMRIAIEIERASEGLVTLYNWVDETEIKEGEKEDQNDPKHSTKKIPKKRVGF